MSEGKELKKDKKVLLMSGGLDSTLIAKLFKPDVMVYCCFGHAYESREKVAVAKLFAKEISEGTLIFDHSLDLKKWEREDSVIPLRNFLAASVASRYGDTIWMGFLKGELATDKSKQFLYLSMALMNECYKKSDWCEGRDIYIESPVQHLTKVQLVAYALKNGLKYEDWKDSISCFGESGHCGVCRACFKRDMAHKLNGLLEEYDTRPLLSDYAKETFKNLCDGKYSGIRMIETALYLSNYYRINITDLRDEANEFCTKLEEMKKGNFTVNA